MPAKHTHTHTHTFNGPLSKTTQVSRYQKGKTSLDFTEGRDSEWQWHQLGHMQVCTSLQLTTPAPHHSEFLQAGCPFCHPTNSIKALKANIIPLSKQLHDNFTTSKVPHLWLQLPLYGDCTRPLWLGTACGEPVSGVSVD